MIKRIYRAILSTCLGVLLLSMLLALALLYVHYDARLAEELRTRAEYLSAGVEQGGVGFLETVPDAGDRVTLLSADGSVLYDNRANAAAMENHADRSEVIAAMTQGAGNAERRSDTLAAKTCYYALRLSDGRVLRLAAEKSTVWMLIGRLVPPFLTAAVFIVLLCAVLANSISHAVTRPISQLDPKAPPAVEDTYEELAPLVTRLQKQNRRIAIQMEELRRRQKEFAVLADNMSEGMLLIDAKAEILLCNTSMASFFHRPGGVDGGNALRLNRSREFSRVIGEVLEGRHSAATLTIGGRSFELLANPVFGGTAGESTPVQSSVSGEAGETLPVQSSANDTTAEEAASAQPPVRADAPAVQPTADGAALTGAVILMVDVTERAERERLRREFTANVSHELKTPLTSIYGSAELLADGIVRPEDVPGFAKDIHAQAQRMIRLVEDILRLSQLDAGAITMKKEPVDLCGIVRQVVQEQTDAAQKQQVMLTAAGESVVLQGVPTLLHEVAANLCDNAVKYNRPGGSVTLTVGRTAQPDGTFCPVLTVKDTGIGIPREHQSRVFERFYRVDKSHSRRIGGTGLGLSIVKHAVQLHGGSINLESEPDVGTTITVVFAPATE